MISVIMKIAGCLLIVSGSTGLGVWISQWYQKRLENLEHLRQMIILLKGQILYANAPLEEAFDTIGRRTEGFLADLFLDVSKRIQTQEGESFCSLWQEEVGQLSAEAAFSKKDRQALSDMGEHLGFMDRDMQERNLLLYLEQLDLDIQKLREQKQERGRLYISLGVMGGLFLSIILC
ncbi:MAG: stage III sporulation protein AB [Lachnospiraceae bacterium]